MARKANLQLVIVAVLGLLTLCGLARADELYVLSEYATIQAAIDDTNNGDVVIVGDGTYTGPGNKNIDFGGLAITVRSENGPEFTIIDCENDGRAFYFHSGEDRTSIVDGFTILNGSNVTHGGGIWCVSSSPTVTNCILRGNLATSGGGGIACSSSNALVSACMFIKNTAVGISADGGGMLNTDNSAPTITNSLFVGNKAQDGGGGLRNQTSSPVVINCTFVANSAHTGGAVGNWPSSPSVIINCILWGNKAPNGHEVANGGDSHPTFSYCDVEGGLSSPPVINREGSSVIDGGGNIDDNPLFVCGPVGDYYLSQIAAGQTSDSPCLDAGSDLSANLGLDAFTTRKDGLSDSGIVDIGYHYPSPEHVAVDIKPGSCPNPFNLASLGVLPVAILGTKDFDVNDIQAASIFLEGVPAIRNNYEDIATPVADGYECECIEDGPDGYTDLTLKFRMVNIVEELINTQSELFDGQRLVLTLTGELNSGGAIEGRDCVVLVGNVPKALAASRWDYNEDGIVNILDFAAMGQYWLESTIY